MAKIAPYVTNVLTGTRIWMCRLTFEPPERKAKMQEGSEESSETDSHKTIFDKYMDGMDVVPLSEAYVMLIPTSTPTESIPADPANAFFCRTAKDGELLRIEEGQIDSGVPNSEASTWMLFPPGATAVYYWTLSPARFKRVIQEVRKDYSQAKRVHDFCGLQVVRQRMDDGAEKVCPFELLEDRADRWMVVSVLRHALLAPASADATPGYYKGYDLKTLNRKWNTKVNPYFHYAFARRKVPDALYCGELAQYHAIGLRQRSAKEFGLFSQVEDICRRSKEHERVAELDKQAEHQMFRDVYYEYAYACARDLRVDRKVFAKAVNVMVNQDDWKKAALEIGRVTAGDCIHPCIDVSHDDLRWQYRIADPALVLKYFDYYRFGIETHVTQTVSFAKSSEQAIKEKIEALRAQIAKLMAGILYYDVVVCLGDYPDEKTLDKTIHERYLDLSLDVFHPWWKTFEPKDQPAWERLKPYVEDIGSFADKAFGTYSEHFDNFENIEKYNRMLESKAARAKELVDKNVKWNQLIGGKTVQLKGTSAFHVEADLEKGVVTIKDGSKDVIQMQLLVEDVTEGTKRVATKLTSRTGQVWFKKVKVPAKFARFKLEPQFKEVKLWPAWLSVFGQVLSLTASTTEMIKTLQDDEAGTGEQVVAVAKVAKDTFQIVTGFSEALHACLPYAKDTGMVVKFAKFGEKIKGPGLVLEALLNLQEGGTILLLKEDSLSASAVQRDDVIEGWMEESRGLVLVASAVPATVAAGGALIAGGTAGAAMTAAMTPLGLGLAIAGVVVVGIDIAVYIHHGPSNIMDDVDKALVRAKVREFGEFFDKQRTFQSLERFSETVDLLITENSKESAWQATTR